jgi:hypothetical protein
MNCAVTIAKKGKNDRQIPSLGANPIPNTTVSVLYVVYTVNLRCLDAINNYLLEGYAIIVFYYFANELENTHLLPCACCCPPTPPPHLPFPLPLTPPTPPTHAAFQLTAQLAK